jgi:NhaA family Na+:H+ antiporter
VLWFALHHAGVHPTIAGVVMGILVPARRTARPRHREQSELEWLEYALHGWSSFVIVPVFAVANAGVAVGARALADAATSPVGVGVVVGLVIGKTAGITLASWLAVRLGLGRLPVGCTWRELAGVAALGGIGFTVSLFVTGLAYTDPALAANAKLGGPAAALPAAARAAAILRVARG